MAVALTNLSHQGRALRRIFDRLDKKSKNVDDIEIIIKIANSMGQLAAQTVRLVDHVDLEKRITNLENSSNKSHNLF